jgi:trimethylamine:corrinoid methyltransferase-like protein
MQSTCKFLSESEQERVHEESLKILQEVGALFHSDRARERVEEILVSPRKNPLPDDVIGKLEDIMKRADEELS